MSAPTNPASRGVVISSNTAKRLNSYQLHKHDIDFCLRILQDHADALKDGGHTLHMALWIAVLVKFTACFGTSVRKQLSPKKVFSHENGERAAFYYLDSIRDKHIAHDENHQADCKSVLWIDAQNNIIKLQTFLVTGGMRDDTYNIVTHLLDVASRYVAGVIQETQRLVLEEAHSMTREERAKLPEWSFNAHAAMLQPDLPRQL